MTIQLNISYEELVELVDQMPEQEQQKLMLRLQERTQSREQMVAEKIARLRSVQVPAKVNQEPSVRREDWYGDPAN